MQGVHNRHGFCICWTVITCKLTPHTEHLPQPDSFCLQCEDKWHTVRHRTLAELSGLLRAPLATGPAQHLARPTGAAPV